ncbi:unnamed protein product [Acanthoscelides obtectus]|uniref:Lipocalin/cytosolic fatty-acid binding domain-containing protein n=1 Tax=Acanthoscelides obtectus TaxID=200917 RepID=A0A9P0KX01_ACAOB|nr:unnamed protein product [Acanthoscelides obtectus]CAK1669173.1 hypothetical protein AOBTE_LOCUS26850 [Acanthoscelides obtectus]
MALSMALGQCQSPPPVKNFDREKFSETWRIHTVVGNPILGIIPPCYSATYAGSPKYTSMDVSYRDGDQYKNIPAYEVSEDHGALVIHIHGKDVKMVILDTDYTTFYTAYYCTEVDATHSKNCYTILL